MRPAVRVGDPSWKVEGPGRHSWLRTCTFFRWVDAMCESTVFLREGKEEKVLMKDVAAVRPQGGKLLLTGVLGEQLEVEGVLADLDLMGHRIVVERVSGRSPRR